MPPLPIVFGYGALLGLIYAILSVYVALGRNQHKVLLGMSENEDLIRRIRIHGNFAEYVPFTIILLAFAEARAASPFMLQALCVILVAGRAAHIYGIARGTKALAWRGLGMLATMIALVGASLLVLFS